MVKNFLLVLVSVAVAELLLHSASWVSLTVDFVLAPPWERRKITISDSQLGVGGNPLWPEHDRKGYRNPHEQRRLSCSASPIQAAFKKKLPTLIFPV